MTRSKKRTNAAGKPVSQAAKDLRDALEALMEQSVEAKTQPAVAKRGGISQSTVSRARTGAYARGIDKLDGLAKAFGLRPWQVLMPPADAGAYRLLRAYNSSQKARDALELVVKGIENAQDESLPKQQATAAGIPRRSAARRR